MEFLDKKYNREDYLNFLKETFNLKEFLDPIDKKNEDAKNEGVETFEQLGFITTDDRKELPIFEIHINPNTKLKRNRVQLRNLVAKEIVAEDGALAVYVDDDNELWRFSFINIEWEFSSEGIRKKQTASKRFTYLFGTDTKTRTAKERFRKLGSDSGLKDLKDAFAVEPLTNEFYKQLYRWYEKAKTRVNFPNDEGANNHAETSLIRFLTRILFVWFLKEKQLINQDLFDKEKLQEIINYDKDSSFYKAILQNLFFATLNRKIKDRSFRRSTNGRANGTNYLATNIYRYLNSSENNDEKENYFKINNEQEIIVLFEKTPFLNGGLFECLDREATDAEKQQYKQDKSIRKVSSAIRIDGFSDRVDNELQFDNQLLFNDDEQNLGLIDLFNQYQFTVEESTPLDVEVALDPELLGKVFENLLASYNPETGEQARKATGSFYTPREIVNYMVDESLKQHFKTHADLDEAAINTLFTEADHSLDNNQIKNLISIIDNLKILDPAVGSGAFPMGILQRLVFILEKIDSECKYFKQQQLLRLPDLSSIEADLKTAGKISDIKAKEKAIKELKRRKKKINIEFKKRDHNYLRKLHLIEHCIYGVDIQSIAIQICKLRFFISLTIEQQKNNKKNYGIKSLPNLETKFIVANSLLPLGEIEVARGENRDIFYKIISDLQQELAEVRHKYFTAKTLKTKCKYKEKDQELRQDILKKLKPQMKKLEDIKISRKKNEDMRSNMEKVVKWDLYNPDAVSDWFDSEWMFGIKDGFDIVIGNPPYIRQESIKRFKAEFKQHFNVFVGTADIYTYFYEKGFHLLSTNGHLCYITSNKWMRAKYGKKLRHFFKETTHLKLIIDFEGRQIFENATVDTNILICSKADKSNEIFSYQKQLPDRKTPLSTMAISDLSDSAFTLQSAKILNLKKKIEATGTPLKEWDINIYRGVLTGFDKGFIIDTATKDDLIAQDPKSADIIKPILRGRDIKAYENQWAGLWIIFVPWHFPLHKDKSIQGASKKAEQEFQKRYPIIYNHLLKYKERLSKRNKAETNIRYEWYALQRCANTYYAEFAKEKIVWQRVTKEPMFCMVKPNMLVQDSMAFITANENAPYLLAVLNSKLIKLFVEMFVHRYGNTGYLLSNQYVEQIPIPQTSKVKQQPFIALVNKILIAKQEGEDTTALESQIDQLVYQLYDLTPAEIKIIEDSE